MKKYFLILAGFLLSASCAAQSDTSNFIGTIISETDVFVSKDQSPSQVLARYPAGRQVAIISLVEGLNECYEILFNDKTGFITASRIKLESDKRNYLLLRRSEGHETRLAKAYDLIPLIANQATLDSLKAVEFAKQKAQGKFYCEDNIIRYVDDFTGELNFRTGGYQAYYSRIVRKKVSSTYLSLHAHGRSVTIDGEGVIVLFTDGSKWSRQVKIDVSADSEGFDYTAYMKLTAADIKTFSMKIIKKYRLYIYDEEMKIADAEAFRKDVNCIIVAK